MEFTAEQLSQYNGTDESKPIYVAIKGRVFDVTTGKSFFGIGGDYAIFDVDRQVKRDIQMSERSGGNRGRKKSFNGESDPKVSILVGASYDDGDGVVEDTEWTQRFPGGGGRGGGSGNSALDGASLRYKNSVTSLRVVLATVPNSQKL